MPKASIAFWRHADLRRILTGELISDFGSEIGELALPIFAATTLNASAAQMAGLLSAEYLPHMSSALPPRAGSIVCDAAQCSSPPTSFDARSSASLRWPRGSRCSRSSISISWHC